MTTLYKFKAFYTKLGVGAAPSSAPVATVVDTDANTKLANAQATTALTNLPGYYEYEYSGADNLDLVGLFHTTDTTTDQQDLVSYVVDKVYQGVALTEAGVDAILDEVVVGSYTLRQLVKVMAAAMAGKLSGGGTTTLTFRGVDDASNVIVATIDANHNRTDVVLTV